MDNNFYNPIDTNLSSSEDNIIEYWKKNKIFEKSYEFRNSDNPYSFYDGPPFVTGLPHYGHLLGSIAKDLIPRYWTMKGKKVRRVWGWDCHGLPVEEKTEKKIGLKNRREIENYGINKFIGSCREYVTEVSAQWNWYVDKVGRWVDIENAYKTMDLGFMESVIWAFKKIYDKGLVYQGKKTLLYCNRCGTPVSKFEIAMDNSYADMEDPAVTVGFKLKYYKSGVGVGIIIENDKGQILIMKRSEPNRKELLGLIGGKMDPEDKTLEDTVHRELKEEIGVDGEILNCLGPHLDVFEGRMFNSYGFRVKINGEPKIQSKDIASKLEWMNSKDIPVEKMHIPSKNCLKNYIKDKNQNISSKVSKPNVYLLAWTTTPWTLPSNKALVVDEKEIYVSFKTDDNQDIYILAKKRIEEVLGDKKYEIVDEFLGEELINIAYEPLYDFVKYNERDYKVYSYEGMVTMEEGTGVVHSALGFGEIDSEMGQKYGLLFDEVLDDAGKYLPKVTKWEGVYVKDADKLIIEDLTQKGNLFKSEKIVHSYPYCYRCLTPLIYRSVNAWFIDIQSFKKRMVELNENINWVPKTCKYGRFQYIINEAPDWCISRTRYWATVMPVWKCEKCENLKVVGSIEEIESNSIEKIKVNDLHRNGVDHIKFKCEKCQSEMSRIPEVLDVWFESGSMPYGERHYPFENKEEFEKAYPADYIVEYIAQTRAWFYYLHVLATCLFDSNCFKNVVNTGVIAGTDGRKMSKMFKNYPDPKEILEKYGGDAFRLYLMGSVLMIGENVNITRGEEIENQVKTIIFPLLNSTKYLQTYAKLHNWKPSFKEPVSSNKIDEWILGRYKELHIKVEKNLINYMIPDAVREIAPFVSDLSSWYIRRSRDRFVSGDKDALETLYYILVNVSKTLAPIIPFTTERIYQKLVVNLDKKAQESIHLCDYPEIKKLSKEEKVLIDKMNILREYSSVGQKLRIENKLKLKQPLNSLYIDSSEMSEWMINVLRDELNVKNIFDLNKKSGNCVNAEFQIGKGKDKEIHKMSLDINISDELMEEGLVREIIRNIQSYRKNQHLDKTDVIDIKIKCDEKLARLIDKFSKDISEMCNIKNYIFADIEGEKSKVGDFEIEILKD